MKKRVFKLKLKFCQEGLSVARYANRDELKAQPTRGNYKVRESPHIA